MKGMVPEKFRFFALFHRDHVWLRDGKRGVDVDFFKQKPLSAMVSLGQVLLPQTLSNETLFIHSTLCKQRSEIWTSLDFEWSKRGIIIVKSCDLADHLNT